MTKTTPPPRVPSKPIEPVSNSASAASFRSPRKILQVKATKSAFLPYRNDEWRSLLDEVKELFRHGRYKECSDRCVAALEQVRGPVHPAHLTYLSFYAALCITIQAQSLELQNPRKLVLLKLSLSFYERSEGFLMQAKAEQSASHDAPPKQEYTRWDSNSSTRGRSLSTVSPTPTTMHTAILSPPLSDRGSEDELKTPPRPTRARTLSIESTESSCPAKKDYKNLFYNTINHYAATPPHTPLEHSLPAKRELKRSGSSSSAHSKTSSIDSVLDEFDFSLPWDANSRRSSASSFTSIASKATTENIIQLPSPQDTPPVPFLKALPPQFLKPATPSRPRKRGGFAPSLPTIISDSCIARAAMDSPSSSTSSPKRYNSPNRPLPPLPLIDEDISETQIFTNREESARTSASKTSDLRYNRIPISNSPAVSTPSKAPRLIPKAVPFRRPLPPLPLTARPPAVRTSAVRPPVRGCNLNFSKPRPASAAATTGPRTSPETAVEAISLFLLSQSRARYNAHILEFYSRIKYHMTEVRKMIADVQFKKAALEAEGRPVKRLSIKELRDGTGCAKDVKWKVEKEEVVKRVRRARVQALKKRGEERKPFDGGRYQELCKLALEELKR
ncbi:hypothetical protein V495_06280 [Pseudogymnoascus sp. VKM F-4514 (FW-929)]|nr:hypothetical protein V495_06280 [Pseudogymnoascus sp. VKM F-4514 (FW-929)]KFY56474.1 hypothetical protein V497_06228 [Pseudogymnoascus sp. VKM F-4516 (FW-969)]